MEAYEDEESFFNAAYYAIINFNTAAFYSLNNQSHNSFTVISFARAFYLHVK